MRRAARRGGIAAVVIAIVLSSSSSSRSSRPGDYLRYSGGVGLSPRSLSPSLPHSLSLSLTHTHTHSLVTHVVVVDIVLDATTCRRGAERPDDAAAAGSVLICCWDHRQGRRSCPRRGWCRDCRGRRRGKGQRRRRCRSRRGEVVVSSSRKTTTTTRRRTRTRRRRREGARRIDRDACAPAGRSR